MFAAELGGDVEGLVFGEEPVRPQGLTARTRSAHLRSVPGLIAAAQIWNAGSMVALLQFLALNGQPPSH